jgi:hypothetical protein
MRPLDHVADLMTSRPKRAGTDRSFVVLHTEAQEPAQPPPPPVDYNLPTERLVVRPASKLGG